MKSKRYILWKWLLSVIWITTGTAVYADESDRLFKVFDSADGLADNGAQVIICTKTGRMVISSIGHINFYNGSSFEHIGPLPNDVYELPKYLGHYHLYFDKQHHLWVKDKYQVTCVDLMTELYIHDIKGVLQEMGFTGQAEDLFVDEDGCVMLLQDNKLYNCKTQKSYPVRTGKILQDVCAFNEKLTLLFYDDSSIEAFDHEKGTVVYITTSLPAQKAMQYSKTTVLFPQPTGFYQISNGDNCGILLHIDAQSGQSNVIMETPYYLSNMAQQGDLLYIASQHGYWTFNFKTGEKMHYESLTLVDHQTIETDINDISFDLQGGMWLGTEKRGLLYSKPHASPFKIYPWSNPQAMKYGDMLWRYSQSHQETLPRRVNCIYRDSRGWKWVGSYSGLRLHKTEKSEPIIYNNKDGLNNDVIHSIIEDNEHNLWVSTSHGICVLMMDGDSLKKIVCYDEEDNIPTSTFDNGLAMKLDDGTIIMQSLDYVVAFDPSQFHTTSNIAIKLYPKVIRLTVNGQNVQPGMKLDGKVILDRAITRAREFDLNYDQNTIELLITGLNYFRPVQTYYRVRVKGFKDEWQTFAMNDENGRVDSKGMLHYPIIGIPPGKYEIEVQASMSPDEWPVDPYVWILTINEPWWRMTIVYAILGLVLLALMTANFIFYNRNTRLRLSRSNIEGGFMNRVKTFAETCNNMESDTLSPVISRLHTGKDDPDQALFADIMSKIISVMKADPNRHFTMVQLSEIAQMEISQFYDVISANLYKSPHAVVLRLRLLQVAELLKKSGKNIDEIAEELHFSSSNYMIASFYHQYRMTPDDYRAANPR